MLKSFKRTEDTLNINTIKCMLVGIIILMYIQQKHKKITLYFITETCVKHELHSHRLELITNQQEYTFRYLLKKEST